MHTLPHGGSAGFVTVLVLSLYIKKVKRSCQVDSGNHHDFFTMVSDSSADVSEVLGALLMAGLDGHCSHAWAQEWLRMCRGDTAATNLCAVPQGWLCAQPAVPVVLLLYASVCSHLRAPVHLIK